MVFVNSGGNRTRFATIRNNRQMRQRGALSTSPAKRACSRRARTGTMIVDPDL